MSSAPPPTTTAKRGGALLPQSRFGGPIPWVIAILIALVVIAAAGGLALRNLADTARADLSAAVTVQVIEPNIELRAERAQQIAALLAEGALVRSVRVVPEGELAALLEPWLGEGATSEDVPIPALIDVELSRRAGAAELDELRAIVKDAGEGIRLDAQSAWLRPVHNALAALQYLALGLIALVALATAAAVWLAARSAFANHCDTVEIIHLLGGTDRQITDIFQRVVLRDAAFGAVIGLILGTAAVFVLGQQFAALDSGMVAGGGLALTDWLFLAAIPLIGVLLALATARITIAFALKAML